MKHHCIYRAFKKRFSVPLVPLPQWHRPCFQLAHDGWSNAIRSNFSSTQAPTLSLTQTPHRHTLLKQEGKTQLCFHPFTPPFVPPPFILITGLHLPFPSISWSTAASSCTSSHHLHSSPLSPLSPLSPSSPASFIVSPPRLQLHLLRYSLTSPVIKPFSFLFRVSKKICTALVNPGSLSLPLHQLHTSLQLNCL